MTVATHAVRAERHDGPPLGVGVGLRARHYGDFLERRPRIGGLTEDEAMELRFVLAPACALIESRWPLARLWEIHQAGYAGDMTVDFGSDPTHIVVHRPTFRIEVSALSPGAYRFLSGARAGEPLFRLLQAATSIDAAFDLANSLHAWASARVITNIFTGEAKWAS